MNPSDLERGLGQFHPASFVWALGRCGWDREEAGEVLQASYLKVLDGRARFDGRSSLKAWFFGVVRVTAAERRRRQLLGALVLSRLDARSSPLAPPASPEELAEGAERRARLIAALKSLPARQREVMELVFYHDQTIEEASRVMSVSVGTARTHYERGKKGLRKKLVAGGI